PSARRLDAAAFASLLWTVAIALPAWRALATRRAEALDLALLDWATVAASLGALGLFLVTSFRVRVSRRLELGVAERAAAALWRPPPALRGAWPPAAAGAPPRGGGLPSPGGAAAAGIAPSAVVGEPPAIARALGGIPALGGLATPVALGAVLVTQAAPRRA